MTQFHAQHHLVLITNHLIAALEIEPEKHARRAEVIIPYHTGSDVYALTCRLIGTEPHHDVGYERLLLGSVAAQLAGQADGLNRSCGALSLSKRLSGLEVQGLITYGSPSDALHSGSTWLPRSLRYIILDEDYVWNSLRLPPKSCYEVQGWVDVPMSDEEVLAAFLDSFPLVGLGAMLHTIAV